MSTPLMFTNKHGVQVHIRNTPHRSIQPTRLSPPYPQLYPSKNTPSLSTTGPLRACPAYLKTYCRLTAAIFAIPVFVGWQTVKPLLLRIEKFILEPYNGEYPYPPFYVYDYFGSFAPYVPDPYIEELEAEMMDMEYRWEAERLEEEHNVGNLRN